MSGIVNDVLSIVIAVIIGIITAFLVVVNNEKGDK